MSMTGELNYFLGLQIKQKNDGIFLNQTEYTKELIKKFRLENAKISKIPMATTTKFDKDEHGKDDAKSYRNMIGSLLYLNASRLDIMFRVCLCVRFQSYHKESHLNAKCIIKYLKETVELDLWCLKIGHFEMTSYSMRVPKPTERVLVGRVNFIGNCLVLRSSNKQNSIAF